MAKSLYSAMFDWIVFRTNHALLNNKDLEDSSKVGIQTHTIQNPIFVFYPCIVQKYLFFLLCNLNISFTDYVLCKKNINRAYDWCSCRSLLTQVQHFSVQSFLQKTGNIFCFQSCCSAHYHSSWSALLVLFLNFSSCLLCVWLCICVLNGGWQVGPTGSNWRIKSVCVHVCVLVYVPGRWHQVPLGSFYSLWTVMSQSCVCVSLYDILGNKILSLGEFTFSNIKDDPRRC